MRILALYLAATAWGASKGKAPNLALPILPQLKAQLSQDLIAEGFRPRDISKMINQRAADNPELARSLALPAPPEEDAFWFQWDVRTKLLLQRTFRVLQREGYDKGDIARWFDGQKSMDWSEEPPFKLQAQVRDDIDFSQEAFSQYLKGHYGRVLRMEEQAEAFRSSVAWQVVDVGNMARLDMRKLALAMRSSRQKDMFANYAVASMRGDVQAYSRLKNIQRQKGPTCGIHAMHNILASFLEERGAEAPAYKDFEKEVVRLLGPKAVKTGLYDWDISVLSRAFGLKLTEVNVMPRHSDEFDELLGGGHGAAYLTLRFQEPETPRGKGSTHAVFVAERWVMRDEKGRPVETYYSVADSNAAAGVTAYYAWQELKPILEGITLLKPENEEAFRRQHLAPSRKAAIERAAKRFKKKPGKPAGAEDDFSPTARRVFALLNQRGILDGQAHFFVRQVVRYLELEGWDGSAILKHVGSAASPMASVNEDGVLNLQGPSHLRQQLAVLDRIPGESGYRSPEAVVQYWQAWIRTRLMQEVAWAEFRAVNYESGRAWALMLELGQWLHDRRWSEPVDLAGQDAFRQEVRDFLAKVPL